MFPYESNKCQFILDLVLLLILNSMDKMVIDRCELSRKNGQYDRKTGFICQVESGQLAEYDALCEEVDEEGEVRASLAPPASHHVNDCHEVAEPKRTAFYLGEFTPAEMQEGEGDESYDDN